MTRYSNVGGGSTRANRDRAAYADGAIGRRDSPTCTGDMNNYNIMSIWASGMSDCSHFNSGDPHGYVYRLMASGVGGSAYDGIAVEIER